MKKIKYLENNHKYLKEIEDQALFDRNALKYTKKDVYKLSRKARRFQLEMLLDLIWQVKEKKCFDHVLEIGCGSGANSEYIRPWYKNYLGIDYSPELIKLASHCHASLNTSFLCINIKQFQPDRFFDLVLCIGVLHHATDLDFLLNQVKKFCHQGTIVAVLEPQRSNPLVQLARSIRKKIDRTYSDTQYYFHRQELIDLFHRNGYQVRAVKYQGYFSVPFSQVILRPRFIFSPLLGLSVKIDRLLEKRFDSRWAWNLGLVAGFD